LTYASAYGRKTVRVLEDASQWNTEHYDCQPARHLPAGRLQGSAAAIGTVIALYLLVMCILIFIGSTVMGITITGLSTYGKTESIPAMFEEKRRGIENA
jgi:hypothetical protein